MINRGHEQVIIIGNGIAGITAARHIRKLSDKKITVISAESEFFFSRTALMYVYMGHMTWNHLKPYEDWFWEKNRISLKMGYVEKVATRAKEVILETGEHLSYDQLILATGSIPRKLEVEGEHLQGVQSLVSKQDLQLLEENSHGCRRAIIAGGGLIGVELAEMLSTRGIKVSILIREKGFWGNVLPEKDALFVSRQIESHGISILPETLLRSIEDDSSGRVGSITTDQNDEFPCDLVGISIGVRPNIGFLKDSEIETDSGILVDSHLRTNIPDIYAIGDCVQHRNPRPNRDSIEAVWYTSRMMGETVAHTMCGRPFPYSPGPWFNSAKFFDLEFQTYGRVWATPKKEEAHYHWESPELNHALTFAYNKTTRQFLGINSFGIRLRHEVCDGWLREEKTLDYVLDHFAEANFNPEFYKKVKL